MQNSSMFGLRGLAAAGLLILAPIGAAYAQQADGIAYSSVTDFDAAAYCETVDRHAPIVKPEAITAIIEDEGASVDGYALADAVLVSAAIDIAHASPDAADCRATLAQGAGIFDAAFEEAMEEMRGARRHRFDRDEPVRSIQQRIAELWQQDQAGRNAYLALRTEDRAGADFWAARLSVANSTRIDENSKRYIETTVDAHGWIDSERFGQLYADHAWILVQHADDYPAFQAEILAQMRPLLESGNLRPRHYAYLHDRVAVNTGNPQYYGTQPTWECENGQLSLAPLDDPENVNERRAAMGMNSVEDSLAQMSRNVCGG